MAQAEMDFRQRGIASKWVLAGFAAVALFFLLTEHRAHLYGWLPWLLLAACPLMHLFHGHGGHAGHGSHRAGEEPRRPDQPSTPANRDAEAPESRGGHRHH